MAKIALVSALAGVLAALVAILDNSAVAMFLALGFWLFAAEIICLTRAAGGFTSVLMPVLVINLVMLLSPVLWPWVQERPTLGITLVNSDDVQIHALAIGIVFCAALTGGALLAQPPKIDLSGAIDAIGGIQKIPKGILVLIGYSCIAVTAYGWQGALLEGRYLAPEGPPWAVSFGSVGIPLAMLALALVATQRGPWRTLAALGVCFLLLILLARSSRFAAVFPAIILVAQLIGVPGTLRARSVALAGTATTLLLGLVLVGRGNPDGVGIIPLGRQVVTTPEEMFQSLPVILGNILISGPISAMTAERPIPREALRISLDPSPGTLNGWNEIRGSLRFNYFTPYNSLGELAAHGWLTLAITAAIAGYLLAKSAAVAARLHSNYAVFASIFVLAIASYFPLVVLQYNLRSGARLVWYAAAGVALLWAASSLHSRREPRGDCGNERPEPRRITGRG